LNLVKLLSPTYLKQGVRDEGNAYFCNSDSGLPLRFTEFDPAQFSAFRHSAEHDCAVLHVYERMGGLKYGEVEVGQEPVIFDSEAIHR
jgi:hypothetical protein